jgi:hypothetical protein
VEVTVETNNSGGLGAPPPAIEARQRLVTLENGKQVVVQKWSLSKLKALVLAAGDFEKLPFVAVESVRPEDRELVEKASVEDVLAVAAAGVELNITPEVAKNVQALVRSWGLLSGGKTATSP